MDARARAPRARAPGGPGLAALLAAALLSLSCEGVGGREEGREAAGEAAAEDAGGTAAPVTVRGALVLEPPRVAVGQVVRAEIAVVTPPAHRVPPPEPPRIPGFWVLETRPLPVEREPGRWIHRTAVRLRAREPGPATWPAIRLPVEGPDGERRAVEIPERPLEVVSTREELPERTEPFGYAAPERPGGRLALLVAAGAGALAVLVGAGALALVRRRRARSARGGGEDAPAPLAAWRRAGAELDAALAALPEDPRAATEEAARALRRYAAGRWGAPTLASTTPELEALRPPYGARSVWPRLLGVLRVLDAARFEPGPREPGELAEVLRQARRLVEETPPPHLPVEGPGASGAADPPGAAAASR